MPVTPEQRDKHELCGARKKNGEHCRAYAGQGTEHPGVGRCKFHGGATRTHNQNAIVTEAKRKMIAFGQPYSMEPVEALLWMVQVSAGHVRYLSEELSTLDESERGTLEAKVATRLWNEERDRLARISKSALDAGVQERAIVLAERTGSAIADLLRRIFSDPELGLTVVQRRRLPDLLRRHLEAAESRRPAALPAA